MPKPTRKPSARAVAVDIEQSLKTAIELAGALEYIGFAFESVHGSEIGRPVIVITGVLSEHLETLRELWRTALATKA
jgi:hypothetical protein